MGEARARPVLPSVTIEEDMSPSLLTAGDVAELLGGSEELGLRAVAGGPHHDRGGGALPPLSARGDRGGSTQMIELRPELARTASTLVVADRPAPRDTDQFSDG